MLLSETVSLLFLYIYIRNVFDQARTGKVLKTISQNVLLAAGDAHQTVRQMFLQRNYKRGMA